MGLGKQGSGEKDEEGRETTSLQALKEKRVPSAEGGRSKNKKLAWSTRSCYPARERKKRNVKRDSHGRNRKFGPKKKKTGEKRPRATSHGRKSWVGVHTLKGDCVNTCSTVCAEKAVRERTQKEEGKEYESVSKGQGKNLGKKKEN